MCKRIIASLMSIVMCFSLCVVPASAAPGDALDFIKTTLWNTSLGFWPGLLNAFLAPGKTPETATPEDWQGAYNNYTANILKDYGTIYCGSDGFYLGGWQPENPTLYPSDMKFYGGSYFRYYWVGGSGVSGSSGRGTELLFIAPVSGLYTFTFSLDCQGSFHTSGTGYCKFYRSYSGIKDTSGKWLKRFEPDPGNASSDYSWTSTTSISLVSGTVYRFVLCPYFQISNPSIIDVMGSVRVDFPTENSPPSLPTETRPGSMTGITYGYQNDSGETIVYTAKDSGLFNENGGYLYNPITGETLQADSWYYDYENRRYDIALPNNQGKATLEYGNEGATITITNSGNTTNIYNYYYMVPKENTPVDPSPSPSPSPTPPAHTHKHTSTVTTEPSCLAVGTRTYTCTCGDTYTEKIPANGHTWLIDRTVNTSYDQDGNIVQQGYTIYKCSVCGNENKVIDGTAPPGSDGEVSQGGFFGWLWGAVKKLLTKVFDAIISLFDFITPGDGQSNFDFYNNPSTFAGGSVWE